MSRRSKPAVLAAALAGLPLAGAALAGLPIGAYLEFPPLTRYVHHAGFSWAVSAALSALVLAVAGPFLIRVLKAPAGPARSGERRPFPWWGWLGLGLTAGAWVLAWSRFPWMGGLQRHTFTPLWLGYILVVNALTLRRSGRCLLLGRPRFFLALFPLSAAFWWAFEYLNRFVQNWYYLGIAGISPLEYFLFATPPFATVLPAVLGTAELLATFPRLDEPLRGWPALAALPARPAGWTLLLAAGAGLMGIGVWPDRLFWLLWVSPLLILTGLDLLAGEETVFAGAGRGDWRGIWQPALAALVCGFFWELWNSGSLAHWEYSVPYVQRFKVFEMPLLGYSGYLPFGLECAAAARLLRSGLRTAARP
ncbi:MAG: hypothetical protein PHU21_01800 [Elusimicrobia bacterium]|nr:hypothetical protein [Elusimicrobiota bacterium]